MAKYFFGIDVSKKTLDIALLKDGAVLSSHVIENKSCEVERFFKPYVQQFSVARDEAWVCLEHTGVYNYPLLRSLEKLPLKICVESALQIKRSQGLTRGKTDAVDAVRIAQYAYKNVENLKIWQPQRPSLIKLKALLTLRERLIKVKVQLMRPLGEGDEFLGAPLAKALASATKNSLKAIKADLQKAEQEILQTVRADEKLQGQFSRATSVTGIGTITALHMIVASGEFERIASPKKFACHAGVAPFEHSSGTSVRGRTRVSKMADMNIKRLLHMAALSASQTKGELRDYYLRKVEEGKNKMLVLNAVRNKLITRVYACVTQNKDYEKNYSRPLFNP